MKNKKTIIYLTTIWFSLQALFMVFWPIYLYYCDGFKFFEVLVTGSILLPASLLIVVKNRIIRNIAYFLLWVYSVPFCFLAFLYIGFGGIRDIFVYILATIYIVNIVLLIRSKKNMWFYRGLEMINRKNSIAFFFWTKLQILSLVHISIILMVRIPCIHLINWEVPQRQTHC